MTKTLHRDKAINTALLGDARILGIDPAIASIGYGLIVGDTAEDYGVITTSKDDSVGDRLISIRNDLIQLIHHLEPGIIGIEMPFFNAANTNALMVQHAVGVIRLTLAELGFTAPVFLHQSQVKAAIATGKADKKEMKAAVSQMYGLVGVKGADDLYDGLAVAYAVQQGVSANVK